MGWYLHPEGTQVAVWAPLGANLQQPSIRNLTLNAPLAERGGRCGPMYGGFHCNEQCCSGNFWCGNEAEHCVRGGCLNDWGVCGQEWVTINETVPSQKWKPRKDSNSKPAYPGWDKCGPAYDKYCREPMCCSYYGYCNTSQGKRFKGRGFGPEKVDERDEDFDCDLTGSVPGVGGVQGVEHQAWYHSKGDHCELAKGCQEGWGTCWGTDNTSKGSASATLALPPAQIAGIAISGFTAICAVTGLIINLVRRRQQGKSINISVPLSHAPSAPSPFASIQLGRLSRGSSLSSSGSLHSVATLLRDVANNVQQGKSSFTAKKGYGPNT